ncbi:DUF2017 domain-containing protein [Streptomyces sp. LX-29]|uniref:DUF2017 domain-containing protein n=1 Tax=Streptomyces sp. LX-29 TaxID=2900152 RepID=UPI00240D736D|nr:DUF2017 domain-containing protein [Streptomyces sp. LX-29]WFB09260.1 DUF2017 domain-containing protein [Streptomyces sp. LX-29]
MTGYFEPLPGGGAAIALDEVQISILRSLAVQLLELIGPGEQPVAGDDPLAALFAEGPSEPPTDPALARLFPDAYGGPELAGVAEGDDPEARKALEEARIASAEFRRYTENDLRARKRDDALAVVRALDGLTHGGPGSADGVALAGGEAVLELDPDESRRWLGALNDLRLAIGTRLEVTDEDDGSDLLLPEADPRKPIALAYRWLGGLQESLVETLMT